MKHDHKTLTPEEPAITGTPDAPAPAKPRRKRAILAVLAAVVLAGAGYSGYG